MPQPTGDGAHLCRLSPRRGRGVNEERATGPPRGVVLKQGEPLFVVELDPPTQRTHSALVQRGRRAELERVEVLLDAFAPAIRAQRRGAPRPEPRAVNGANDQGRLPAALGGARGAARQNRIPIDRCPTHGAGHYTRRRRSRNPPKGLALLELVLGVVPRLGDVLPLDRPVPIPQERPVLQMGLALQGRAGPPMRPAVGP